MQWVKTLTVSICIMTIISQLIPQEKYTKYVRFYSGLMFLLIAAGPVLELFTGETGLTDCLKIEFLKEEYGELEQKAASLTELKTKQIQKALEKESSRQIIMLASAYGFEDAKVSIRYGEDYTVGEIELWIYGEEAYDSLQNELKELFAAERVVIHQMDTEIPVSGTQSVYE